MKAAPGRRATIGETTKSYIRRQVIKGEFKTAKTVHQYLNGLGYTIGYSGALKLLKTQGTTFSMGYDPQRLDNR
ncbi:hypothetical protein G6F19_014261 [Rhizopus arrhizus]|nr:hypothetical protein G6F23_015374 [Rhizopus arrhizus]KAG0803472.1 hypothetical protein G6F19_014261 [Rhizopus arrhizus]